MRPAPTLCLLLGLAACASLQPYDPPTAPGDPLPERVRLVLHSGERVTLDHPTFNDDSTYVGIVGDSEVRRIPMADVDSIYGGEIPGAASNLFQLVGGLGLALVGGWYLLTSLS